MDGASLAHAKIINLDGGGSPIECMFNPKEYSFSKRNQWTAGKSKGSNMPQLEFGGGQPATLQMQLFFDTYAAGKDVRKEYTDSIWQLMMVDQTLKDPKNKKGRPPKVRFQWGSAWSFDAVRCQRMLAGSVRACGDQADLAGTPVARNFKQPLSPPPPILDNNRLTSYLV